MKRFFTFVAIASVAFATVSCGSSSKKEQEKEIEELKATLEELQEEMESEPDVVVDTRPRVYANAYDGFTNIRATPSSKGTILGKLRNGPEGALFLREEGNWIAIDYNGTTGYVYKTYVQNFPTKAVTVDVDGKWLEGVYLTPGGGYSAYIIFDNGYYAYEHQYGTIAYGRYKLEGNEIVLTAKNRTNDLDLEITPVERLKINVGRKTIGGMSKSRFISEEEWEEYGGEIIFTKDSFKQFKKHITQLAK